MPARPTIERLELVADILMGAAHADGTPHCVEVLVIEQALADLLQQPAIPDELRQRIATFDIRAFDVAGTCAELGLSSPEERRELLKLVARVTECDQLHDFEETDYIVRVATCIGASRDEYAHLTVDVQYEPLPVPPPVPADDESK